MEENKDKFSQIEPSEKFKKEINDDNTYYRYKDKVYKVNFNGNYAGEGVVTWWNFRVYEIKYTIWPQELALKLKDIVIMGTEISREEYLTYKDFYDTLDGYYSPLFLENNYIYWRLRVSLK